MLRPFFMLVTAFLVAASCGRSAYGAVNMDCWDSGNPCFTLEINHSTLYFSISNFYQDLNWFGGKYA